MQGHFLLNDRINDSVLRIYERFGEVGRDRMHQLAPLKRYPSDAKVVDWEKALLALERELIHEQERAKQAVEDRYQLKFPWS